MPCGCKQPVVRNPKPAEIKINIDVKNSQTESTTGTTSN